MHVTNGQYTEVNGHCIFIFTGHISGVIIISILSVGKLKVSSIDAMSNGLTDESTETF